MALIILTISSLNEHVECLDMNNWLEIECLSANVIVCTKHYCAIANVFQADLFFNQPFDKRSQQTTLCENTLYTRRIIDDLQPTEHSNK